MIFFPKQNTIFLFSAILIFGMVLIQISSIMDFSYELFPDAFAQETKQINEQWLFYDNSEQGVLLQYPKSWEQKSAGYKVLVGFYSPLEGEDDNFAENVIISTQTLQKTTELDEYVNQTITSFKKVTSDFTVEKLETTALSGLPAKLIEYQINISDIQGKGLQIITIKNNTAYSLTYGAESKNFDDYLPLVNKMIQSFTIKEPIIVPIVESDKLQDLTSLNHSIPSWFKNNAGWWGEGQITDEEFFNGMQFLMDEKLLEVPEPNQMVLDVISQGHLNWAKGNTLRWSMGTITTEDFVVLVQFFIENQYVELKI